MFCDIRGASQFSCVSCRVKGTSATESCPLSFEDVENIIVRSTSHIGDK